jgi:hypothetical protein
LNKQVDGLTLSLRLCTSVLGIKIIPRCAFGAILVIVRFYSTLKAVIQGRALLAVFSDTQLVGGVVTAEVEITACVFVADGVGHEYFVVAGIAEVTSIDSTAGEAHL